MQTSMREVGLAIITVIVWGCASDALSDRAEDTTSETNGTTDTAVDTDTDTDTDTDSDADTEPCAAGMSYFEPGCGGEPGMPVIEAGCYAPCEGAPCEAGICRLTDINPCICEPGMDCCAACGMNEWLCLDPPEACANIANAPLIASAVQHIERCPTLTQGNTHWAEVWVEPETEGDCMAVGFQVCTWDLNSFCTSRLYGTLTPAGQARAAGLAVELTGIELNDLYGCPSCDDNEQSSINVGIAGDYKRVEYEWRNPPEVLARADAYTQGLVEAFQTCTSNDDVIIDPATCTNVCEP